MRDVRTKSIEVRLFSVGNTMSVKKVFRAAPGKYFSAAGIEHALQMLAEDADKRFPEDDFALVDLGNYRFNIVWRGKRKPPAGLDAVSA